MIDVDSVFRKRPIPAFQRRPLPRRSPEIGGKLRSLSPGDAAIRLEVCFQPLRFPLSVSGYAGAGSPCTREVTGEIRVMKMVSALILFAGLLWLISVLVGLSLCAVARRSDDATARMTRDPWLN